MNAFPGFPAPPARQAHRRLAGNRGRTAAELNDLPLTAFFRRHSDAVSAAAIVAAIAGAAAFGLPFLIVLAR